MLPKARRLGGTYGSLLPSVRHATRRWFELLQQMRSRLRAGRAGRCSRRRRSSAACGGRGPALCRPGRTGPAASGPRPDTARRLHYHWPPGDRTRRLEDPRRLPRLRPAALQLFQLFGQHARPVIPEQHVERVAFGQRHKRGVACGHLDTGQRHTLRDLGQIQFRSHPDRRSWHFRQLEPVHCGSHDRGSDDDRERPADGPRQCVAA